MSFWPVRPFVTLSIATLGLYESTGDVLRHLFRYSIVNERWQVNLPKSCGADRDRTDDLRLAKPALSQLSYSPVGAVRRRIRVGQGRVELPTSRLSGVRSNHLSYWPGPARGLKAVARLSGLASLSPGRRLFASLRSPHSLETESYALRLWVLT
jgi:hypothetical protein